jgi:RNA polymerase sigma factor (sigma-70 family)
MSSRTTREPLRSRDLVQTTLAENAASLLRIARRFSLCADDAQDAYQRAVEIFLRRADTVEPETAASWLRTVVKHEAIAVRRSRLRLVGRDEVDLDLHEASGDPSPDERLLSADFTARSAEALKRLKPQELRALWLKAQGHSYAEIGEMTGWSYTKVNRCITEGRRAFLDRYAGIESGAECRRWASVLSAMADGEATAEQLAQARPHLRNCPACRATLRDYHDVPREIGAVAPALATGGALASLRGGFHTAREFFTSLLGRAPGGAEAAGAAAVGGGGTLAAGGMKAAALCASVSIAAGGTYCLDHAGDLSARAPAPPTASQASPAERATARTATRDRLVDRDARRATSTQLAPKPTPPPPRRPAKPLPEPTTTADPGGPTGFTFESGDTGQPQQPQPQPTDPPPPPGEFDGGGFE